MKTKNRSIFAGNYLLIFPVVSFLVKSIQLVIEHSKNPEAAASGSGPWYKSILVSGSVLAAGLTLWRVIIAVLNKLGK